MDATDLRNLSEQLAKSLLQHRSVEAVRFQIGRVVSYLISEQDKRKQLGDKMEELSRTLIGTAEQPGLIERLRKIEERSQRNGRLLFTVLGSVITAIALQLIRLYK